MDSSSDGGNCSAWSVVTGRVNGSDVTATTTQQQVAVSTEVRMSGKVGARRLPSLVDPKWDAPRTKTMTRHHGESWVYCHPAGHESQLPGCYTLLHETQHAQILISANAFACLCYFLGQIDGGFLSPGTPYYVQVSAINSVGVSEAQQAETEVDCGDVDEACAPRAPPPPPTDAKVQRSTEIHSARPEDTPE